MKRKTDGLDIGVSGLMQTTCLVVCMGLYYLLTLGRRGVYCLIRTRSSTSLYHSFSTPVSQGPEESYCTSSPLCECGGQWFLEDTRVLILSLKNHNFCEYLGLQLLIDARRLILSWGVYSLTWTLRDRSRERAPYGCA